MVCLQILIHKLLMKNKVKNQRIKMTHLKKMKTLTGKISKKMVVSTLTLKRKCKEWNQFEKYKEKANYSENSQPKKLKAKKTCMVSFSDAKRKWLNKETSKKFFWLLPAWENQNGTIFKSRTINYTRTWRKKLIFVKMKSRSRISFQ